MTGRVVAAGESVILYVNSTKYLFADVEENKKIQVGKANIQATELVGKQYGATFSVDRNILVPLKLDELLQLKNELGVSNDAEAADDANNSKLNDDNTSQKLSQADIAGFKESGMSGKDVIKAIVGNSSTFHTKTEFSKEKYLKKKSQKHITTVQILKGTANTILTAYYEKNPLKICNLRGDSLALLLNLSNIFSHPDKKVLVVESCQGLIVGSVAERMGGLGKIFVGNLETSKPSLPALRSFNFSKEVDNSIITFPIYLLTDQTATTSTTSTTEPAPTTTDSTPTTSSTDDKSKEPTKVLNPEKEAERARMLTESQAMIQDGADSLLVVSKYAPQTLVPRLVRALKGGAAFAVYGQHLQPLAETHEALRNAGLAVNMSLAETWLRVHQVLPARTHPNMQMDGASGYILHGVRVIPDSTPRAPRADKKRGGKPEANKDDGKGTKRKSAGDDNNNAEAKVSKTEVAQ